MKKHARVQGITVSFTLLPISTVHLDPASATRISTTGIQGMRPAGDLATLYSILAIGLLILVVASINFVNLMTARAVRRAVEVGIRKVLGADRRDLILQFIGETTLYAAFGMIVAIACVEVALPLFNAALDRQIRFDYWHDLRLSVSIAGSVLLVGTLAGTYPAFILAAFRPAFVLKNSFVGTRSSGVVRHVLVIIQFAILIGLVLATTVIYRQTQYAENDSMRLDKDQVLVLTASCRTAFKEEVKTLPGVLGASCSRSVPTDAGSSQWAVTLTDGTTRYLWNKSIDFGFFELYGLKPVVGRFFARDHGEDAVSLNPDTSQSGQFEMPKKLVINEQAAHLLGFNTPEQAIGQYIKLGFANQSAPSAEIVGVVPDFLEGSVRELIEPTAYYVNPNWFTWLNVKLSGHDVPETLQSIDRLWKKIGDRWPIHRMFLDESVQELYAGITRQTELIAAFAGIAVFISCLGLFGLAAFTSERRTKEIGIRKALGATRWDILKLLVWQFTKPVLWANLLAWPIGWYFMNRWLHGFAYHVDLEPWVFLAASFLALEIALITVSTHAFIVARARPINALRYE